MKKSIKNILCMVLVSAFMIITISAADIITPMGLCYFEVTGMSCTCTEVWEGTVLKSRDFSPSSISHSGTKHGESHSGSLSIFAPSIGSLINEYDSGGYTYRIYNATATYKGYLSCDSDVSEIGLE